MEKQINVGMLGFGTVGSGVATIIKENEKQLSQKLGADVRIKTIAVRDTEKYRDIDTNGSELTTVVDDVINDESIKVIVEVMGGIEEAHQAIEQSLRAGKAVITANKDLMALHGHSLLKLAEKHHADLYYEASVAGGIPIIRTLEDGLASDRISTIMGIVNGTTNYILTKMKEEGWSYEDALTEAQALGFAESDPTSDVEGLDAARKMAILATLAFSMEVYLDDVEVTGMTNITAEDMSLAEQFGYSVKMLGFAEKDEEGVDVAVEPVFLKSSHPLAAVRNEYNAVYVYGDAVGETMFYGPGAGSMPTATSVVSDVIAACRNILLGVAGARHIDYVNERKIKQEDQQHAQFFHRLLVKDKIGVFSALTDIYGKYEASLSSIIQRPGEQEGEAEVILITHPVSRKNHHKIVEELKQSDVVKNIISQYRVEGGDR
ncbi:homoserine dehydrogenase [Jeotgalibacillus alimentarius]|uniref:Homoserine dehydrogenase n=1 Tax=Jeotgalibacillus alimentarius TaxID=135826 RepID=A0A0C2S434_9BACL|nr:homoserine dehydrogenase [Jeotgalibacillus alimentarius]KIL48779.1 homoserine dehydrogenase [Jeotgalibacillus alimentarius]